MDKNANAVNVFNKLAQLYQEKFMDVSAYRYGLDLFCKAIEKQDAAVLEIACGPGNVTKYILAQRPGIKLLGTDGAPNMVELARENNLTASFKVMDGRDIVQSGEKYDGILCGFFLPYLSKTETIDFIANAAATLNPGGILYLSTMEDDYSRSGYKKGSTGDEIFMHYHETAYLKEALEANHFKLLHEERIHNTGADTDLVLVAKKDL
jgi:2-polyprenyl-3-methyl-5-hydroxy-6-metoxy-1,4-benzoquinol methylase